MFLNFVKRKMNKNNNNNSSQHRNLYQSRKQFKPQTFPTKIHTFFN